MNSEDMNDAELESFLKGEDALSGELQAMQQASPSAELDAAILSRAQEQMERDSRPVAANDATDGVASKAPLSRLGLRWRVPAGIAATLMAGVLAHQAWQASADHERAATVSAPVPAQQSTPAPQVAAEAKEPSPVAAPEASLPAPFKAKQAAPLRSAPVPIEPQADAVTPQIAPAPALAYSHSAPAAPAPAPANVADAAKSMQVESRSVQVSGRRSRVDVQRSNAAPPAQGGALTAAAPDPKAWLAAIDELFKAGLRRDTLEEWDKFRAAYPDYPVPADTVDKINALRK